MISDAVIPNDAWEWMWAPYDESIYAAVLENIALDDIVLEIGAGDGRLARRIAYIAQKVYAIEWNKKLLKKSRKDLPANCYVLYGDARSISFPHDVTVAVLLMRHCTHFFQYWSKLAAIPCRKLITNARWGMNVERIDLRTPRIPFAALSVGWYACSCGGTGFVPAGADKISSEILDTTWEVIACPACVGN